ncbi:MAG: SDR family oxidoreductase [Acidobacteria bacterium]|nr:SDR family oxidoreductase [Acidobacteriota bacterium]
MSGTDDRLDGKVAVITGASRGIGKQAALRLASHGAKVVIAARTVEARANTPGTLGDTADELRALGCEPLVLAADLSRQDDLDRLVASTLEHCGGVDILINNAAYTVGKALFSTVPELTRDQWEKGFAINVTAPLMLTTAFWESMSQRGGGVVINVTSPVADLKPLGETNGLAGSSLPRNGPLYGASKAALDRMANVVAATGMQHNIAVINLVPGHVLTETMDETYRQQGIVGSETGAIPLAVPAAAIDYLCTIEDPMRYSGQIVNAPALVKELSLTSS